MALIQCNETLLVGVRQFDGEHSHLIEIINRFHAAVKSGEGCTVLQGTFDELANFARMHFLNEETVLMLHGYPELEEHHTIHNDLLDQLDRLDRKTVCDSTSLQYELLQFLMDWLMNHTRDVDKKYGPFLNSKGVY
jgi:hemerythrin-like metal-binding protein